MFACKLHSSLGKMLLSRSITSFPFLSLEAVFYKTSNLGDHILKTVSSINLNQIHFKNGRGFKKKSSEAYIFLEEKYLFTQIRLSLCETTFMILLLVLSHHFPLFLCGKKKG